HILAWVSRQQSKKWFLWAHYIDPHGRYVAHPDVVDYGSSEPDLYDAEIRWTDQEIGRLLAQLVRLPSNAHTIIVLTSDHGDSMAEHTVPLGTHGTALYRELLHVPMIFYIPENKARTVGGAVSNLDIVPTIAALAGIDVHDLQFEGRSLVPQLFYGKEDPDRIVFAETNAPTKQRAAISTHWKLIYYITSNLFELYDLVKDPWEHDNLAATSSPTTGPFAMMKAALDAWMERVVYQRDPKFNQAYRQVADVTLPVPPTPQVRTEQQSLADGNIEILGVAPEAGRSIGSKAKVDVHVYFHVKTRTDRAFKLQLVVWPLAPGAKITDPIPPQVVRTPLRPTADGFFPSSKWRADEYIRERFPVTIPDWQGSQVVVGLVANDGRVVAPTGLAPANEPNTMILGVLPFAGSAPPAPGTGSNSGSSTPAKP
ncbi:MAG: sulfatase-like hydrolase/transferase, partial [Proteobacteria bacterium]|nr:sulfatase-like hydrolase/transferase [Pseudomonadota bacterium]